MKFNLFFAALALLIYAACNSSNNDDKKADFTPVGEEIAQEKNANDSVFERNGFKVHYLMSYDAKDTMPVVFERADGNGDIFINKGYINNASAAEKAVLAFYSKLYNSGCQDGVCELTTALGHISQNSPQQDDLIKKWFKSGPALKLVESGTASPVSDSAWNRFKVIKLRKLPYEIHTTYTRVDDQNKETTVKEVYQIKNDEELTLQSSQTQ